jgi:hypothetical protein
MPSIQWPDHQDVPMIGDTAMAALLAGADLPAGAAPELRPLAQALAELRGRPASDELAGEADSLAAFRQQFSAPGTGYRPQARNRPLLSRRLPAKAAAAVALVLGLGGAATAAYAGSLPPVVQRLAHDILGAPAPGGQPASRPSLTGPGPATYGLCTAWAQAREHGTGQQRAAAFRKLAVAAGGAGNVTAYCATATPPGTPPSPRPTAAPTPHGSGKPTALPTPQGSGKPTALPTPQDSGKPTAVPTPHSSRKPTAVPTPQGPGKPAAQPTP